MYPAPLEAVARLATDFAHYPGMMPRVRESRVIHRRRDGFDVYFQLELPRALGVAWFLERMVFTRRDHDHLEVSGTAIDGNIGRVEMHSLLDRLPGSAPSTRFRFSLYGVPNLPLAPVTVTTNLRAAVQAVATSLGTRLASPATQPDAGVVRATSAPSRATP